MRVPTSGRLPWRYIAQRAMDASAENRYVDIWRSARRWA